MSDLYRGPSIDASYQVSVYLAKGFQRRRFFWNRPIRNKISLWWPCFLTLRDEMINLHRSRRPFIDASYQVSVHLEKRFQRRFLEINQSETKKKWWQKLTLPLARWAKHNLFVNENNNQCQSTQNNKISVHFENIKNNTCPHKLRPLNLSNIKRFDVVICVLHIGVIVHHHCSNFFS